MHKGLGKHESDIGLLDSDVFMLESVVIACVGITAMRGFVNIYPAISFSS